MERNLVAKTQITVHAPSSKVWAALTTPELIKKYLMGADVHTDWKIEKNRVLQATHFSTSSGKEDKPENYALVTWHLDDKDESTVVSVSQDSIESEKGVEASMKNWHAVLQGLKKTVEGG